MTCQCYNGKRLLEDGHFTAVGAFNVLEHVDDPSGFLDELVRVTRPGGVVVVSSPNFFDALAFVTIILVCADGATSGGTFFA